MLLLETRKILQLPVNSQQPVGCSFSVALSWELRHCCKEVFDYKAGFLLAPSRGLRRDSFRFSLFGEAPQPQVPWKSSQMQRTAAVLRHMLSCLHNNMVATRYIHSLVTGADHDADFRKFFPVLDGEIHSPCSFTCRAAALCGGGVEWCWLCATCCGDGPGGGTNH